MVVTNSGVIMQYKRYGLAVTNLVVDRQSTGVQDTVLISATNAIPVIYWNPVQRKWDCNIRQSNYT
jgi:hypothetical protein